MPTPLLFTKLYLPPFVSSRVPRTRLTERLTEGLQPGIKLTLLAAPAGSGKTVILSEWLALTSAKAAWLSLDEGDNDPIRFWDYVVAALQRINASLGQDALALLHEPTPLPIQSILVTIINDISAVSEPFVLVLDDYHAVSSPAIHEAMAFLLDRLPPALHLVMTTRTDPPLPLARLRARSELLELRAGDLQFNLPESAQLVSRIAGIRLPDDALQALEARTEGWAAGLQLAALAMRGQNNPAAFIESFAGNSRFILDYLGDEVLDKQPPTVQQFLMRASILRQLSGELCAAVTGDVSAKGLLETLERSNFFIYPVDDKRRWYRYHQLFRDFLQHRLQQSADGSIAALHQRASAWLEEHGYLEEAIHHALAIPDYGRAAQLVESVAELMIWRRAELHTLMGWLGALPDEFIRSRPKLALYHAWTFYLTAAVDAAFARLQAAEQSIEREGLTSDPVVQGMRYAIESTLTGIRQNFSESLRTGRLALEQLPESAAAWRCMAALNLGVSSAAIGEMDEAAQRLNEAMELSQEIGSAFAMLAAFWHLATLQAGQLRLRDAERTCKLLEGLAESPGVQRFPVGPYLALVRAEILLERHQLEAAEPFFLESAQHINPEGFPMALLRCYTGLARLKRAQLDLQGSEEWFRRAEQQERLGKLSQRSTGFGAYRGWRLIQDGDLTGAWRWANENRLGPDDEFGHYREAYYLVLARLLLVSARSNPAHRADALRLLDRMVQRADSSGRAGSLARALALQALALDDAGESSAAGLALGRALAMAEPEQSVMTFADEGPPMARLIQKVRDTRRRPVPGDIPQPSPEFLAAILAAIGPQFATAPAIPKHDRRALVEPLSERELEVLHLLCDGQSSNEIAARLIISVETARKHIKNIYGKLDVHSQFEAARRAHDLGLI